jgi:hypothetical protein
MVKMQGIKGTARSAVMVHMKSLLIAKITTAVTVLSIGYRLEGAVIVMALYTVPGALLDLAGKMIIELQTVMRVSDQYLFSYCYLFCS